MACPPNQTESTPGNHPQPHIPAHQGGLGFQPYSDLPTEASHYAASSATQHHPHEPHSSLHQAPYSSAHSSLGKGSLLLGNYPFLKMRKINNSCVMSASLLHEKINIVWWWGGFRLKALLWRYIFAAVPMLVIRVLANTYGIKAFLKLPIFFGTLFIPQRIICVRPFFNLWPTDWALEVVNGS